MQTTKGLLYCIFPRTAGTGVVEKKSLRTLCNQVNRYNSPIASNEMCPFSTILHHTFSIFLLSFTA